MFRDKTQTNRIIKQNTLGNTINVFEEYAIEYNRDIEKNTKNNGKERKKLRQPEKNIVSQRYNGRRNEYFNWMRTLDNPFGTADWMGYGDQERLRERDRKRGRREIQREGERRGEERRERNKQFGRKRGEKNERERYTQRRGERGRARRIRKRLQEKKERQSGI